MEREEDGQERAVGQGEGNWDWDEWGQGELDLVISRSLALGRHLSVCIGVGVCRLYVSSF